MTDDLAKRIDDLKAELEAQRRDPFPTGCRVEVTTTTIVLKKPRVTVWLGLVVGPSVYADGWYLVRADKRTRVAAETIPATEMRRVRRKP